MIFMISEFCKIVNMWVLLVMGLEFELWYWFLFLFKMGFCVLC